MATSKKVTDLTALTSATADDLLLIVDDPSGTPTSKKITTKNFLESNATSNVVANGSLVITGLALVNAITVAYTSTPANATNVPAGFTTGTIWSDGAYIYVVTGVSALKRVAIATW